MSSRILVRVLLILFCEIGAASQAYGQNDSVETRTTYGDLGILEMPNARMAPDGQIAVTVAVRPDTQRYSFAFQALPWLDGSFRYSHIPGLNGNPNFYDRSFGFKIRLSQEDDIWPEVSLGVRDLLGTGIYGSEYVVASKRLGSFDLTAGMGWGRLAQDAAFENPLGLLFPSFKASRPLPGTSGTGTLDIGQLFHGPNVGIFGGVVWSTPIDGLAGLLEYSTDRYEIERRTGAGPIIRSQLNEGLAYQISSATTISGGWYYGSTWGATLSFDLDPTISPPVRLGAPLPLPANRSPQQQNEAFVALMQSRQTTTNFARLSHSESMANDHQELSDLRSVLLSEGGGVRAVDVEGTTVLINAERWGDTDRQCEIYAQIAHSENPHITKITLSDSDDAQGRVEVCAPGVLLLHSGSSQAIRGRYQPDAGNAPPSTSERQRLLKSVAKQSVTPLAFFSKGGELWLYYDNSHYMYETEAAGQIARVLMVEAPPDTEVFHLISVKYGLPLREITISRSALEARAMPDADITPTDIATLTLPALNQPLLDNEAENIYPRFHWSIHPGLRESVFDPNAPFQFQVLATAEGSVEILPGLSLDAVFDRNIYNDFRVEPPDSSLPHVRSDISYYLKDGVNAIDSLLSSYHARLAPDIFGEFKVGYLEPMFAGAGGQILWRPDGSRLSVGVDLYEVVQRGFDELLNLQSYRVLTGHLSAYYESPYYGLNFAVHAGRYLAGDYGATFEINRRFASGVEIGAFATFTNVPFSQFGEGSFDKGIVVRIPLEWGLPIYTQSSLDVTLRSLTRDGGQRLYNDDSLFDETQSTSGPELARNVDELETP